jgi:hypothetical protein
MNLALLPSSSGNKVRHPLVGTPEHTGGAHDYLSQHYYVFQMMNQHTFPLFLTTHASITSHS